MMPEIDRDTVTGDIVNGTHEAASIYATEALLTKEQQKSDNNYHYNHNNSNSLNNRKLHAQMAASAATDQRDLATPVNNYVYRSPLTIPPTNYRYDHMYNNSSNIMAALSNQQQQYMAATAAAAAAAAAAMGGGVAGMELGGKDKLAHLLKLRDSPAHHSVHHQHNQHLHTHQQNLSSAAHFEERSNAAAATNFLQKTLEAPRAVYYNNGGVTVAHPNATASAPPPQTSTISPPLLPPPPRSKTPHPRRTTATTPPPPSPAATNNSNNLKLAKNITAAAAPANTNMNEGVKGSHKSIGDLTSSATWHPHVYGHPPNRPTPHSIADILGLHVAAVAANAANIKTTATTHSTTGIAVLIDESSNSSLSAANHPPTPAKSPKSILRTFQQQLAPPAFDMRSTSASDASEEDMSVGSSSIGRSVVADMSDQPLNLCVAKKPRASNHSPPPQTIKHNSISAAQLDVTAVGLEVTTKVALGKTARKGNGSFLYTIKFKLIF